MPKPHKPYDEKQRGLALKRAQKFTRLFRGPIFDDIVDAAQDQDENAFKIACKSKDASLEDSEIAWLWNYLKECKFNYYDPVPEASAGTGW